ncbi:MAG TPA: hypothetical protein VJT49_26990 [Amycolatopsis sp.]|uniref:hypothetical protein n=1 Tax=Amycolatopsis sp. TaxID=37632 RepID=UPI002B481F63|nr:hypothetical protein [Amycolatopsis sp.]HKS48688.1 hypothetical protein [Amycolatopsis sp.]
MTAWTVPVTGTGVSTALAHARSITSMIGAEMFRDEPGVPHRVGTQLVKGDRSSQNLAENAGLLAETDRLRAGQRERLTVEGYSRHGVGVSSDYARMVVLNVSIGRR